MDTTPSRGSQTLSAQDAARNARKAAAASWAGTALEQFDFSIYVAASALVFSKVFFPAAGPQLGTALSLATLGIGYVIRPIAATAIGHPGDRWSRKKMLVFTVTTMSAAIFLIGCLPTAAAIGVWAPVLLVVLRVVQGVSAAGEPIGSVTMALEHSPTHRRGFYGSWTNTGAVTGIMLGSLAFVLVRRLPPEQVMSWGWRVPF